MPFCCRKNVTAIWQLASGGEADHKPAIRMSPTEIVAFADGADQLLAGVWSDAVLGCWEQIRLRLAPKGDYFTLF
jgi:hypothetical protein